jgi:hypothetical protein
MSDAAANAYLAALTRQFCAYRQSAFPGKDHFFEHPSQDPKDRDRPPVFLKEHAGENVMVHPGASPQEAARIRALIRPEDRHRWFRSMRSSQALAQTVFGNLLALGKLGALAGLQADAGAAAFFDEPPAPGAMGMEHKVSHLGERKGHTTSIDVFFDLPHHVAVECKLSEPDIGGCSRPRLQRRDKRYETEHCDGSYTRQRSRAERCALSEAGIRYWEFVPRLFRWLAKQDHVPCPLATPYQLVRNVLGVCVRKDDFIDTATAHALLLYDARNPAFRPGGEGLAAYHAVKTALLEQGVLRRCSWQRVLSRLRQDQDLVWLADALRAKYGLCAEEEASNA